MSMEECRAFAYRIRTDDVLAAEVVLKGRDTDSLLAIARVYGYSVEKADLRAFAKEYATQVRRERPRRKVACR